MSQEAQSSANAKSAAAAASPANTTATSSRLINMRYYEQELPEIGELVHVKYTAMTDNSVYVQLTEYANIQGMITFAELHRGRITAISQHASIGKEDILSVIRLDAEKKYIDLSKRTMTPAEKELGNQKAQRGRDVLNYMCTIADSCGVPLQDLMTNVAWPLYKMFPKTESSPGGALEGLKLAVSKSDEVFGKLPNLQPNVRKELDRLVQAKLKPKIRKYECEVSCTCTTVEGVESIKAVLMAAQKQSNGKVQITVKASPHFLLRTQSADREEGLKTLTDAFNTMMTVSQSLSVVVEKDKEPCEVGGAN
jgi:translation initiation factor 2 subunit 1